MERFKFAADRLIADHPPVWGHPNKRIVFDIACPPGSAHRGEIGYSRWPAVLLPERLDVSGVFDQVEARPGFFDYSLQSGGGIEWHVNFADEHLFAFYGSALFAQDEIQTAEHPILGSLREALIACGATALAVEHGMPTPVLVTGAERRCHVATDASPDEGRPNGLYGNAFGWASTDAIRRATRRIEPPTITNLIAMAAPTGGRGRYRASEIEYVLVTALSAFRAAVSEGRRKFGAGATVVHSGHWGCGAFGGNRVLMAILQILAAEIAGVDRLIFHTGQDRRGWEAVEIARRELETVFSNGILGPDVLIERLVALGFEWGVSDGN